jgi:hypothetical protein
MVCAWNRAASAKPPPLTPGCGHSTDLALDLRLGAIKGFRQLFGQECQGGRTAVSRFSAGDGAARGLPHAAPWPVACSADKRN